MPLEDGYKTERELKELSTNIAESITMVFEEMGKNRDYGFILFLVDFNTGTLQYISDMKQADAMVALRAHVARETS